MSLSFSSSFSGLLGPQRRAWGWWHELGRVPLPGQVSWLQVISEQCELVWLPRDPEFPHSPSIPTSLHPAQHSAVLGSFNAHWMGGWKDGWVDG